MALSRTQRTGLTPQEIEFMSMERHVEIVPLFSMKELKDLDQVADRTLLVPPPSLATAGTDPVSALFALDESLWSIRAAAEEEDTVVVGDSFEEATAVQDCRTSVDDCRYALSLSLLSKLRHVGGG